MEGREERDYAWKGNGGDRQVRGGEEKGSGCIKKGKGVHTKRWEGIDTKWGRD